MPIPAGWCQCSIKLLNSALTRPAAVTYAFERAEAMDTTANANLALSLFKTHMAPRIDSGVTIGPATIHIGSTSGESFAVVSTTAPGGGGASLQSPPPNVAVLLRKQTARGGRRGRGRMYVPWACLETDIDEAGLLAVTAVNAWTTAAEAWRGAHVTNDAQLGILHEPGVTATWSPDPLTGIFCDRVVATQRRRLVRA